MEPEIKSNKSIGIFIGIVVIVIMTLVAVFSGKKPTTELPVAEQALPEKTNVPVSTETPVIPPADVVKQSVSVYKDGTYTATGSYMSPGGPDKVGVTLTLKNDIITDASVTPMPGDLKSAKFQDMFISGYKAFVVGKNIADVNLTKVSGSSLTPIGFNNALAQIKVQAKA